MRRRLLLLVGLLLVFSLACSALSLGRNDEPPVEDDGPGAVVTVEVQPDDDMADDDVLEDDEQDAASDDDSEELSFDSGGLEALDSYRATLSYELTKADGTVETFYIEQAATRSPRAQRFMMSSADGDIEYIQIEDQMYIRFGDEWIQGSSDDMDESDFGSFLTTSDDWIAEIDDEDYEYIGKETVNGLATRHYRVNYSAGWLDLLDEADADGDIDNGTADVWIADEAGLPEFIVRYRVQLEGTLEGDQGTATLSQDVTDVNQPITIEAPEGVAMGGLPEGVPVYPGATDLTSFGTMTTFTAPEDLETVATFYEDAFTSAGWEKGEGGMEIEGMSSSTWTKDGEQLTLTITEDDDGLVTVLVMMGE
ncbi:MAG: hypothetical protein JXC32_11395 [Anaerolineae bacterium]|nr:hypothetical protein [Anaerolineae bacterium]